MYSYKEEVFLIKGRYYTFTQNHTVFPLIKYGAVEGGLTIDRSKGIGKYDGSCVDILVMEHNGKWGVFPRISFNGMGCADWASENDRPFVYDDYLVASSGVFGDDEPDTYETFLLLKEDGLWKAFRDTRGTDAAIDLPEETGLSFGDVDAVLKGLEERYALALKVQDRQDMGNDEPVFDTTMDFVKQYSIHGENRRFIEMIFGLEKYSPDKACLYAAAHQNAVAAILIGKSLLDGIRKADKDGEFLDDYGKAVLGSSIDYLTSGKRYAEQSGDTTMADIAEVFLDQARMTKTFGTQRKGSELFKRKFKA
ncbi:MAG: hypothetical protein K5910_04960 [Bacteroidales bacterium]|nr:hypothetical protein [Bacteroidales bacterium]